MAVKTANVNSRMKLDIKQQAEDIPVRDELTTEQFNQMMSIGLRQAKEDGVNRKQ